MTELQIVSSEGTTCVHHWMLADPDGGQVIGECRNCLATKVFPASPESTQRFDDYREMTAPTSYSARLSA